jgi:uncharacterized protein
MVDSPETSAQTAQDAKALVLRSLSSVLMERYQFAKQHGLSFSGARDLYGVLGYERDLTPSMYRDRYRRGGIAGRVVKALPKATWRGGVELVEDEDPTTATAFEKECEALNKKVKLWARLQQVDILSQLGNYAVLLIGAKDDMETELPKGRPGEVLYLTPFAEEDAKIQEYVTDASDPRFGLAKTYQLKRTKIASPQLARPVHHTRVIHVAEGLLDDEVNGEPSLESVWNYLDDLDKVSGGGAEAFWLRANAGLQLDIDKDMSLSDPEKEALKVQADEYQHSIRRMLRTRGVSVNQLGSDTANFQGPVDAIMTLIAGAKGIPKRILTGSEQGELASSQDRSNWQETVKDRRTSFAEPCVVRPLIDRLVEYGYLPEPKEYDVRWPEMENLSATERAALAASYADVNAKQGAMVITVDEIRDWALSKDPLTPEQIAAGAPEPPPEPEPAAPADVVGPDGEPAAQPPVAKPDKVRAAEGEGLDEDLLKALEEAIKQNDVFALDSLLGTTHV